MIIGNANLPGHAEAYLLVCACLLDYAIGDPRWLPHPVRLIGAAIARGESLLRRVARPPGSERAAGALLAVAVVLLTYFITLSVQEFALGIADDTSMSGALTILGFALLILLAAATLALRGLVDAALLVIHDLQRGDLQRARQNLSMIVGRDTAALPEESCAKATIETLAENLSDGVIAPLFYFAIGGLPLAMAYKAVNTLDSMIGYRNDRYRYFGWAAARLDDSANYIPARIAGVLIAIVSLFMKTVSGRNAWHLMMRDGRNHLSPNSGTPEAAIAGALGIQLGGPSTYEGAVVSKPSIGDAASAIDVEKAFRAVAIIQWSAGIGMAVTIAFLWASA